MRRSIYRILAILTAASALFVPPASAGFGHRGWSHYSDVILSKDSDDGYYRLVLPPQVLGKSRQNLNDLRLADQHGRDLPCALQRPEDILLVPAVIPARLMNLSGRENGHTVLTFDLGNDRTPHSGIMLDIGGPDFDRALTVEGSDNEEDWHLLANRRIFSFADEKASCKTVSYPADTCRYLRIRIANDSQKPLGIDGVYVQGARYPQAEIAPLSIRHLKVIRVKDEGITKIRFDLGFANLTSSSVALDIRNRRFFREVEILGSSDTYHWRKFAGGMIFRYEADGSVWQKTTLELPLRTRYRFLMLVMHDAGREPLKIKSLTAYGPPTSVYFKAKPSSAYRLFFGNAKATRRQPAYRMQIPPALQPSSARLGEIKARPIAAVDVAWRGRWAHFRLLPVFTALLATLLAVGMMLWLIHNRDRQ